MRLLACYINGFGRIRDYAYTFDEGLNAILEDNGAGKTTFCVFIKSMFYGMEYSGRRKSLMERRHYQPWDGGVYGGSLDFAIEDRKYRIERSFGRTNKTDTFRLINLNTMQESRDYSENIGEEIFAVDRESFEKSIFIPQEALDTKMTDSFNARIGNGETARDDVVQYDAAVARVDKAAKDYTRNSNTNTGKIVLLRREMKEKVAQADQIPALEEEVRTQQGKMSTVQNRITELENQKNAISDEIVKQSRREQELGAYHEKEQMLASQQKELEELQTFFAAGVPKKEELDQISEQDHELTLKEKELSELEEKLPKPEYVEDLKEVFGEEVPGEGQMKKWKEAAAHLRELRVRRQYAKMSDEDRQQLQETEQFFIHGKPSDEDIQTVSEEISNLAKITGQVDEAGRHVSEASEKIAHLEQKQKGSRNVVGPIVSVLIVLALAAGGFLFLRMNDGGIVSLLPAIVCFGLAALVAVLAIVSILSNRHRYQKNMDILKASYTSAMADRDSHEAARAKAEKICTDFLAGFPVDKDADMRQQLTQIQQKAYSYDRLKAQEAKALESSSGTMDELADASMELYTVLQPYANHYGIDLFHSDGGEETFLNQLEEDANTYRSYVVNVGKRDALEEDVAQRRQTVLAFISQYPVHGMNRRECLDEIRHNLDTYTSAQARIHQLQEELKQQKQTGEDAAENTSVEELQKQQTALDTEITDLNGQMNTLKTQRDALLEELDQCEEAREDLASLKEREGQMQQRVDDLECALKYLNLAREKFIARYMGPLQTNMRRYASMLSGDIGTSMNADAVTLDMDLHPKVTVQGNVRDEEYFSAGYQDLLSLCARFALIDVLYQNEQPMVILDDPFANLDKTRMANAMDLLWQVAGKRQIIYFTCHESRMP